MHGVGEEQGGEALGQDGQPDGEGQEDQAGCAGDLLSASFQVEVDEQRGDCAGGEDEAELRECQATAGLNVAI